VNSIANEHVCVEEKGNSLAYVRPTVGIVNIVPDRTVQAVSSIGKPLRHKLMAVE
jgi:hypothetical protein